MDSTSTTKVTPSISTAQSVVSTSVATISSTNVQHPHKDSNGGIKSTAPVIYNTEKSDILEFDTESSSIANIESVQSTKSDASGGKPIVRSHRKIS